MLPDDPNMRSALIFCAALLAVWVILDLADYFDHLERRLTRLEFAPPFAKERADNA